MKRATRRSSIFIEPEPALNQNKAGSISTRFSMPSFIKRVEKLTNDQRIAIKRTGFGNLLLIPNQTISKNLLAELMDKWNCETRAFELLPGQIMITPMDVVLILGLRVNGDPVLLNEDEPFSDLEEEYGADLCKRKITVSSLETRLDSIGGLVNDDFVKTFLLFTFGTFLFPNANGKVDSRYLCFLKDLNEICKFAWGAAVLEDVFMWLSKRKELKIQYVGGCLLFLQIWSYEHVDVGRPNLLDSNLPFPRACRWAHTKSHQRQWFAMKFKELQDHQIIWMLQPLPMELEVGMVEESLEAQKEGMELPKPQTSSTNFSVVNSQEDNEVIASLTSDQIGEVEVEMNTNSMTEIHRAPEVSMKQLKVSQDAPEVLLHATEFAFISDSHKESRELASTLHDSNSSTNFVNGNEDDSSAGNQMFEEKIVELMKEMDKLRKENIELKNQLLSNQLLEEQNSELKKEVSSLRRENRTLSSSSNNLVLRLEKLLLEEDIHDGEK